VPAAHHELVPVATAKGIADEQPHIGEGITAANTFVLN